MVGDLEEWRKSEEGHRHSRRCDRGVLQAEGEQVTSKEQEAQLDSICEPRPDVTEKGRQSIADEAEALRRDQADAFAKRNVYSSRLYEMLKLWALAVFA